jgi:beta-lactamase class A
MGLKEKIEEVADGLEGTLGVAVKHLGTGKEVLINGDDLFPLASALKVPVLITLYRQVDEGKIGLDDKLVMTEDAKVAMGGGILQHLTPGLEMVVRDYGTLMMMISDNTATVMLVDLVGRGNINETMRRLEVKTNIVVSREHFYEMARQRRQDQESQLVNMMTPRDMMALLEKLYRGEAASRSSCDDIIDLMKRCQTGENRLRKYLPRDKVEVADKTGTNAIRRIGSGARAYIAVIDVGIVFPKERDPYIICCFSKDLSENDDGEEAIATVSKFVYEHFVSET